MKYKTRTERVYNEATGWLWLDFMGKRDANAVKIAQRFGGY